MRARIGRGSHWWRTAAQMVQRGAVRSLVLRSLSVAYAVLGLDRRYARLLLFARDLTRPGPAIQTDVRFELSELSAHEADTYCRLRPDAGEAEVRRRLASGYRCLVSRVAGQIVGDVWFAAGDVWLPRLGRRVRLGPSDVYLYYASLSPELRGRNIGTARSRAVGEWLRREGYRRAVYAVSPYNRPALGVAAKLGAERLGSIGYVRVGPLERNFIRLAGAPLEWSRPGDGAGRAAPTRLI